MSTKLNLLSLPGGRKEPENGYLSLLIHLLHEHTIDHLRDEPPTQFNIERFFAPANIKRRSSTTRILRSIVKNSATNKKQLDVLAELESLRSAIENIHKEYSVPKYRSFVESLNDTFMNLELLLKYGSNSTKESLPQLLSTSLEAFEQFGGLYVILDILFLDRQIRALGPEFVLISDSEPSRNAKSRALWLLNGLLYLGSDVRTMFRKSETLLSLFADAYRASYGEEGRLIRLEIAGMFQTLAVWFETIPPFAYSYRSCQIVESLTETALQCHADKNRTNELRSTLRTLLALIRQKEECREDFIAIEGSMDLIIDLFGERRESDRDYLSGYKSKRFEWILDRLPETVIRQFIWTIFCLLSFVVTTFTFLNTDIRLGGDYRACRLERFNCSSSLKSYDYPNDEHCNMLNPYPTSDVFNCSARFDSWNYFSEHYINSPANVYAFHHDFLWADELVISLWIVIIVILILLARKLHSLARQTESEQMKLAGGILMSVAPILDQNPRALERFRQRDVCALLALYLDARPLNGKRYWDAAVIIGNLISGAARDSIEIERKRLIELGVRENISKIINNRGKAAENGWWEVFDIIHKFLNDDQHN